MADPNILPEDESKKDTVRINLPPGMVTPGAKPKTDDQSKRDTAAMGADQAKKETAMMGMPAEAKKETSRVAVPAAKSPTADMPRPTVRLRREPGAGAPAPGAASSPTPAARAQVPEMPRPTVKLKVEETIPAAATEAPSSSSASAPSSAPAPAPVMMEAGPSGLDVGLSLAAAVLSVAVLGYLAFALYK